MTRRPFWKAASSVIASPLMASRQEPNRPEEHFNSAIVELAPRPPRSKMVVRHRSSSARLSPAWTSNGTDLDQNQTGQRNILIARLLNLRPGHLGRRWW